MAIGFSGLGLRTKLSIVSALLIILTAAGIAGTLVRQEQREARAALENEGVAVLSLLSEAGSRRSWRASLRIATSPTRWRST